MLKTATSPSPNAHEHFYNIEWGEWGLTGVKAGNSLWLDNFVSDSKTVTPVVQCRSPIVLQTRDQ